MVRDLEIGRARILAIKTELQKARESMCQVLLFIILTMGVVNGIVYMAMGIYMALSQSLMVMLLPSIIGYYGAWSVFSSSHIYSIIPQSKRERTR